MARGWESKAVEEQIESSQLGNQSISARRLTPEQLARQREIEGLRLSRARVLHELASFAHPQRRESLTAALKYLEEKLASLG